MESANTCMKCGKELKTEQSFCQHCLDVMESYPVKPDVHIQLPNRPANTNQKRSGKKRLPPTAEELLVTAQNRVRALVLLVLALIALLGIATAAILYLWDMNESLLRADQRPAVTQSENCFT